MYELNVHTTLVIPRFAMKLLGCWPIQKNAGWGAYLQQQFLWWLSWFVGGFSAVWLAYRMYISTNDIDAILNAAPDMSLIMSQMGKQLICKFYHDELRVMLNDFDRFLKESTPALIDLLHRELRMVYIVHAIFIFGCIADPIIFSLTPLVDGRPLPGHAAYPWSLNSTTVYATIYLSHVSCAVTLSCMANMDVVFSTLIWCTIVRFRYLNAQLLQAQETKQTRECAAEQQRLIKYEYTFDHAEKLIVDKSLFESKRIRFRIEFAYARQRTGMIRPYLLTYCHLTNRNNSSRISKCEQFLTRIRVCNKDVASHRSCSKFYTAVGYSYLKKEVVLVQKMKHFAPKHCHHFLPSTIYKVRSSRWNPDGKKQKYFGVDEDLGAEAARKATAMNLSLAERDMIQETLREASSEPQASSGLGRLTETAWRT